MGFSVLYLLCLCVRLFICALWSPAGKGLTSWLSFVVSNCEFVAFPFGILGQVWCLIVSILIFAPLLTFKLNSSQMIISQKYCALILILRWINLRNVNH